MPPAIGLAIAGIASGVAGIYGAHKQSSASNRAADIQGRANTEALAYEKDVEARRRQEYDQQQILLKQQWDAEQARLAPGRAAKAALLQRSTGQGQYAPKAQMMPTDYTGTIGAMARPRPSQARSTPAPRRTLADISNWNQWGPR